MGFFSNIVKLVSSPVKAIGKLLKGDPLGAAKGLVKTGAGALGSIPGIGKIGKGIIKGVGQLLPLATSAAPLIGLPPLPGLGGIVSSMLGNIGSNVTPARIRAAMPDLAQQLFGGAPGRGVGLDLLSQLQGVPGALGGIYG